MYNVANYAYVLFRMKILSYEKSKEAVGVRVFKRVRVKMDNFGDRNLVFRYIQIVFRIGKFDLCSLTVPTIIYLKLGFHVSNFTPQG